MSFLLNLFSSKPVAPERVATDTVIPLHSYDGTKTNRSMCLDFSMHFDDALDAHKLVGALERLLEKPGWRKLGARLRENSEGKLEYHIPAQYSKERPSINLTRATHDISIAEHPLASKIPRPTGTLQVTPALRTFRPLFVAENAPTKVDDYLYTDRAQLSLHIVTFTDATLVTLSWCHTLLDAMGRNMLLRAWTAMLEGREEDVPEFYGYDFDPLATLGNPVDPDSKPKDAPAEEDYVLKDKMVSGLAMFQFVFNFMWELFVYKAEEMRTVIIPPAFFQRLRSEALDDLKDAHPSTIVMNTSDPSNPKPFLSDGDVLCAWWTRHVITSQPWVTSGRPTKVIQIINVFGMRNLLTNTLPKLLPPGVAYIANAVISTHSFFSLQEFLSLPLGRIAARIRSDLATQSTRAQVDAGQRLAKEAVKRTGYTPMYGGGDMIFSAFSNWAKGKMFETDFSAAVVKKGNVRHEIGKPTYIQVDGSVNGFSTRNSGPCLGKDHDGNYWVAAMLRPTAWENLEKTIEALK